MRPCAWHMVCSRGAKVAWIASTELKRLSNQTGVGMWDRIVKNQEADERQLNLLEWGAVIYLLSPVLCFLVGWFDWRVSGFMATMLAWVITVLWRQTQKIGTFFGNLSWGQVICCLLVALFWVSCIGLVGFFRLNMDWATRMPILRDLAQLSWPIGYAQPDGVSWVLRFPSGYYLIPAGLSQILGGGESEARVLLWLWTVVGAFLFLTLLCNSVRDFSDRGWVAIGVALSVCVGFSGMDALGQWLTLQGWPALGDHLEWWVGIHYQYSSNTTLMFFVPNHALAGWLAALIVWRHQRSGLAWLPAIALMLGVELWSPLVAIGLVPFLLGVAWLGRTDSWRTDVLRFEFIGCGLLMGMVGAYLTLGVSSRDGAAPEAGDPGLASSVMEFMIFTLLEWALLAWVVGRKIKLRWVFIVAVIELLLFPFFHFGPGNDLVMRGSIPALTVLMLVVIEFLLVRGDFFIQRRRIVVLMMMVGLVTPLNEFYRNTFFRRVDYMSQGHNFVEISGTPWHYVARFDPSHWLWRWMAPPAMVPAGQTLQTQPTD